MHSLLLLNQDVQTVIYQYLRLQDILVLQSVSRKFREIIVEDKQLWLELLDRFQASTGAPVVPYRVSLENASAAHVAGWLKQACLIRTTLSTETSFSTSHRLCTDDEPITWVKLVRGRWCLVASASTSQSRLRIWDVEEGGFHQPRETFYLAGPVIDGIVDDDGSTIHIAMSIGIRVPEIRIYSLCLVDSKVHVLLMATIPNACHLRVLSGETVGFAVYNGDDSHSYVANWTSDAAPTSLIATPQPIGERWKYRNSVRQYHSPCYAMHIQNEHILVLLGNSIEVFAVDLNSVPASVIASQSLRFSAYQEDSDFIADGSFFFQGRLDLTQYVHFTARNLNGDLLSGSVQLTAESEDTCILHGPNLCQEAVRIPEGVLSPLKTCMGSSFGYQLCLSSCVTPPYKGNNVESRYAPPVFMVARNVALASPSSTEPFKGATIDCPTVISRSGLPLLFSLSASDFDDAAGIVLFGTACGGVHLARFIDCKMLPGALINELPACRLRNIDAMSQSIVPADLPSFFHLRDFRIFVNPDTPMPESLVKEAQTKWNSSNLGILPISDDWSNIWEENRFIRKWLVPKSPWGDTDLCVERDTESWSARIRQHLPTLGEIIPVIYHKEAQDLVIFRIGCRAYYYCDFYDDEDTDYHIGTLELEFDRPFREDVLENLYDDRLEGDLDFRFGDQRRHDFITHILRARSILEFSNSKAGARTRRQLSIGDNPEAWSASDWFQLHKSARQLEEDRAKFGPQRSEDEDEDSTE